MISFKQHREKVLANTDNQKVFITMTIIPDENCKIQHKSKNNTIDIVFAVDTSASMRDAIDGTSYRKIDFIKESIKRLQQQNVFFEPDRVGLVSYDTESQIHFNLSTLKGHAFFASY